MPKEPAGFYKICPNVINMQNISVFHNFTEYIIFHFFVFQMNVKRTKTGYKLKFVLFELIAGMKNIYPFSLNLIGTYNFRKQFQVNFTKIVWTDC